MKKILFCVFFLSCMLSVFSENVSNELITKGTKIIRVNSGFAFANRVATGESAWHNSNLDKSSCGFQYGVDALYYFEKYWGCGITFRHYTHNLSTVGIHGMTLDEDIRIFYVAPQFSNVEEDFLFKGLISNIDLGLGYAHYANHGTISGNQKYSAPASGLGVNLNLGFEYKFNKSWGVKLSISGEYYFFKNMHNKEYPETPFDKRSKLSMFILSPQIGISYHL